LKKALFDDLARSLDQVIEPCELLLRFNPLIVFELVIELI